MSIHDKQMPKGWHTIKSVLLKEIHMAANFHLCCEAASALFHARLIGESIAEESNGRGSDGQLIGEGTTPQEQNNDKANY